MPFWVQAVSICLVTALVLPGCWGGGRLKETRQANCEAELAYLRRQPKRVATGPINLDLAIRVAMRYNLDVARVELQKSIETERATGQKLRMLPDLKINGGYTRKTKPRASSSHNPDTDRHADSSYTYSEEKITPKWDLGLAWNILDFGLSYLNARRSEKEAASTRQQLLRLRQNLALRVTESYWDAVVAQLVCAKSRRLLEEIDKRLEQVDRQIAEKTRNEVEGLEYKQSLLQTRMRLEGCEHEWASARTRLSELMGLSMSTRMELTIPPLEDMGGEWSPNIRRLEEAALLTRPEMVEHDLQDRIAVDKARIELVRMFPNFNLFVRREHENSRYLYKKIWYTLGVDAAFQILSIPAQLKAHKSAKRGIDLSKQKRLAMALGVMTQVRLAVHDYHLQAYRMKTVKDMYGVQERLSAITLKRQERGDVTAESLFNAEVQKFFAHRRYVESYGAMMVARARINNTLGRPANDATAWAAGTETAKAALAQTSLSPKKEDASPVLGKAEKARYNDLQGEQVRSEAVLPVQQEAERAKPLPATKSQRMAVRLKNQPRRPEAVERLTEPVSPAVNEPVVYHSTPPKRLQLVKSKPVVDDVRAMQGQKEPVPESKTDCEQAPDWFPLPGANETGEMVKPSPVL